MDGSFTEYLQDYNIYAEEVGLKRISVFDAEQQLTTIYNMDRHNIYDKLENIYKELEKYNLDFMCKVYCSGRQIIVSNEVTCHVCDKNYKMSCGATIDNDRLIHSVCRENDDKKVVYDFMQEKFNENNLCSICEEECDSGHIVMINDTFCHKSCCINATIENFKDLKCFLCSKPITKHRMQIEYCTYDEHTAHVLCAKASHKSLKYKKIKVNLSLNKCGLCSFYTVDNKYFHTICQKKLKQSAA
jgi:hypothetical protein